MSTTCSIKIKADNLPKLFSKFEFFLFRAMEQKGMDFYKISKQPKTAESIALLEDIKYGRMTKENLESLVGKKYAQGLITASNITDANLIGVDIYRIAQMAYLFNTIKTSILPSYVTDYIQKAKALRDQNKEDVAKEYEKFAANLENMLVNWQEIAPNFLSSSEIFNVRTKFKMDDEGLVDLNEVADDEKKMLNKMVFDQPANEIDPIDDVDKAVELFLRSIHVEDSNDEYGYTVNTNYSNLIQNLFEDLQNSIGIDEIIKKLEKNADKVAEYKQIIDKIKINKENKFTLTQDELQFRINFTNSFAKAFVPIGIVSIEKTGENGVAFKVLDAASGKSSLYESIIKANFTVRGMKVNDGEKDINLAHQENGVWMITKEDLPKIYNFLDRSKLTDYEYKKRRVEFLKGLGFDFSEKTETALSNSTYLGAVSKGSAGKFDYIYNHLIKAIERNDRILDPISTIKLKVKNLTKEDLQEPNGNTKYGGQNNTIVDIIESELKNNTAYNLEKSFITADGNRMFAIQLHNNFTVLNKFLSDADKYPTLQSITDSEPSMFWLDPIKNPSIRSDYYLNSLFYMDPSAVDGKGDSVYGQRRKIKNDKYSFDSDAVPVKLTIKNTGGLQYKIIDEFEKEGASSTSLNELDKILQDIHGFFAAKKGYTGVLRLGDKSTDLGIGLTYGLDFNTKNNDISKQRAIKNGKPLNDENPLKDIFNDLTFKTHVKDNLVDYLQMRYLGEKGFFKNQGNDSGLKMADANYKNWSYFQDILSPETKSILDGYIKSLAADDTSSMDSIADYIKQADINEKLEVNIKDYFNKTAESFYNKINKIKDDFGLTTKKLIGKDNLKSTIYYYIANTFITDLSQMKLFFGDAMYFKDFHKRASKDSATGIFTIMDQYLIDHLNDSSNAQGYGAATNISAKFFIERVYQNKLAELEKNKKLSEGAKQKLKKEYENQRDQALAKQTISKSFKSAVLKDVKFKSDQGAIILKNIETIMASDKLYISEEMKALYNDSIKNIISNKYSGDEKDWGTEADGQGKCTFDFYRIMSIATSSWLPEQEQMYKKIVEYNHYDELAEETEDIVKKAEYIRKRDAVGYKDTDAVYFPPRKFQYSGPENYTRLIDGSEYNTAPPVFDKFSLQPLIPTVVKKAGVKTADWYLARKMEYNGVGYVKFESGSKAETPSDKDEFYSKYDPTNPSVREISKFEPTSKFKSEQELFYRHFKEQVAIDAEIHDHAIFGSQIRKLILMNLDRPEFQKMKNDYTTYLTQLVQLEKNALYDEMGIRKIDGKLKVGNLKKTIEYFFNEISKKNQDINVRKALNYDETTGKFDIPLDATVQSQVLEGIIISAINNRVVRYKTNGSMLVQMAITGSEPTKFNKDDSAKALETEGNSELKYYDVLEGTDGKTTVTKMDVKIALTGQWLNLLNLDGVDKRKIETLDRLNEALKDENWRKIHEKKLSMIAYRIPTQGRNFMDVMLIKEFLPASVGDAIVMPSEIVIKNGGDFDIDKMFVFYPNLTEKGNYMNTPYTETDLQNPEKYKEIKGSVQNRLYETMSDILLHPSNYIELVTPSDNFHISPLLDKIFEKLGSKQEGKDREKTDYKNTKILERELNYKKFLSLLKGKSDLGIAAVANTFNVLFQLSNATSNGNFLFDKKIRTFFNSDHIEKSGGNIINIDFSSIFDEDNVLKSEFFSEFINAFVDVARDDYVFAANVVTELSPVMFYMKFAGIGSGKILNFMNQPGIRQFTNNLAVYQNKFVKLDKDDDESVRTKALSKTLRELGYIGEKTDRTSIEKYLIEQKEKHGITNFDNYFTEDNLLKGIRKAGYEINGNGSSIDPLSEKGKLIQIAMLLELENLKVQAGSLSDAQKFLNFDTSPYKSSFDASLRKKAYEQSITKSGSILSGNTIRTIKNDSVISHLDMGNDIQEILADLFPVRNNEDFNNRLLTKVFILKNDINNKNITSQDDMTKFARTAKNDYLNFIIQNYISKSQEGMKFFYETFETTKSFNEYLAELVETPKLRDMWNAVKDMKATDENNTEYSVFELLTHSDEFPFIKNIINTIGSNNPRLNAFSIVKSSSNEVEKNSVILQFDRLSKLIKPEDKPIADFFKNLALYSIFQSGMNTSDVSYTDITPVAIVNKLYGYATIEAKDEYSKLNDNEKNILFKKFYKLFASNNPSFFGYNVTATPVQEKSSRGKWYAEDVQLQWKDLDKQLVPAAQVTPSTGKTVKVISDADIAAYNTYLGKSNGVAPKEFFTSATTFKIFYNPATGKREKAPQSSKWILQDNGLYNLIDKDGGELYIEDVDLKTGMKIVKSTQSSTQPSNSVETARTIYDKINKDEKTQSENVILPKDVDPEADNRGMIYTTAIEFWRKIVPEAMDLYNKLRPLIVAFRGNSKKTFLQNYNSGTHTIGNPFDWKDETGTREEQGIKSTKRFIHWMITGDNMGVTTAAEEYRQAIINDIKSGKLKKASILYYEEKGYATHATALDYLINKYDWNAPKPAVTKPVETGTKPGPVAVKIFKWNKPSAEIGSDADVAMRKIATSSIVEFKSDKVPSSSLTTMNTVGEDNSYSYEKDRYVGVSNTGGLKNGRVNFGSIVMLARNGKLSGTALSPDTIAEINEAHKQGAKFLVGDMQGVDTPFIDHLNKIGAVYAIYGHGRLKGVSDVEKTAPKPTEEKKMPKKPFERTFVAPTRDAQGNVISKMTTEDKINKWIQEELPWTVSTPASELAAMYEKEKESGETIEEFLNGLSCLGKLI